MQILAFLQTHKIIIEISQTTSFTLPNNRKTWLTYSTVPLALQQKNK